MTIRQACYLFAFAILLSVGQILFKQASQSLNEDTGSAAFSSLLSSVSFWSALVLYGGSTLLWIWLIRDIPLVRAYPFVALAFIVVPILSHFILDERMTRAGIVGATFIFLGIVISQS